MNFRGPVLLTLTLCWTSCGGTVQRDSHGTDAGRAGLVDSAPSAGGAGIGGAAGGAAAPAVSGAAGEADFPLCEPFDADISHPAGCTAMCGSRLVDLWSDWTNCGSCGHRCEVGAELCDTGTCVAEVCSGNLVSCSQPGCHESLDTADNCGACGVVAVPPAQNTVALCGCSGACGVGSCAPGYANCDQSSNDCETPLNSADACVPKPASFCTSAIPSPYLQLTMAPDGAVFISGALVDETHPDPTLGPHSTYVTKFNPDGSQAWTQTWPASDAGSFAVAGLHAGPDGSIAVFGQAYAARGTDVSVDLDPSSNVDMHTEPAAVVKLDASGAYLWGRTWGGDIAPAINDVAFDRSGRAYIVGQFVGTLDADPGPGSKPHGIGGDKLADFLLSLDESGDFRWSRSVTDARCDYATLLTVQVTGDRLWAGGGLANCAGKTDPPMDVPSLRDRSGMSLSVPFLLRTDLDGAPDRALPFATESGGTPTNIAIGSGGDLYLGVLANGLDVDPGPAVERRTGRASIVSLTNDGAYRWAVSGNEVVANDVSPLPDDGILGSNALGTVSAWNSSGTPRFSIDSSNSGGVILVTSSVAGLVMLVENKTHCPNGLEARRYTW
ncbi:MAG TPA: hypothetical protein VER96_34505 [Polyangiaceae bacterium]|nr:hypothetical protein [Polyangiaceae bacterium]